MLTVYPDLAFALGVVASAAVYILTLQLTGITRPKWQIALVMGVSGILSAVSILPTVWGIISAVISLLVALIFFRGKNFWGYLKNLLRFVTVALLFFGLFLLFSLLFGPILVFLVGGVYFSLSFLKTLLSLVFSFITLFLGLRFYKKRISPSGCCDCIAVVLGKRIPFCAYIDTGNFLKDPLSGFPVVILEYQYLAKYFKQLPISGSYAFLSLFSENARIIPVRSVSGEGAMLFGFIPDSFFVNGKEHNAVIALSERPLEGCGRFSGIIGPDFIGGTV